MPPMFEIEHVEVARHPGGSADLGITIVPSRICHRIDTRTGIRPANVRIGHSVAGNALRLAVSRLRMLPHDPRCGVHRRRA
jgi:hypothetical protein